MMKSITPPSVLPMLTPANETTISDNPCIIEWKTYKVGAMNKNRNSIGSDIPVTNETNIAETSNPLIENLFSFLAQQYIAQPIAGSANINVGINPCDKNDVALLLIGSPAFN